MAPHDVSNGRPSDPEPANIPSTIVAYNESDGRVVIYDEERRTAWISSTHAIPLQNAS